MRTIYDQVKDFLDKYPKARERRHKDKALVSMLCARFAFKDEVPRGFLETFVQEYSSYDRAWRLVLMENPSLRGSDYKDKVKLEQEKEMELGYDPLYERDRKKLKTL